MANLPRRKTVTCNIAGVRVGSDAPIVVQSMTNTDTADVASTVQQVAALARAGSELVRVTVNTEEAAVAVAPIVDELGKQGILIESDSDEQHNLFRSHWALVSSQPIEDPAIEKAAEELILRPELRAWTDDYNNLFQILK